MANSVEVEGELGYLLAYDLDPVAEAETGVALRNAEASLTLDVLVEALPVHERQLVVQPLDREAYYLFCR